MIDVIRDMPNLEDFNNDFKAFNAAVIDEFRNNGGQVTGMFAGAPLVLITTTGAKSGQRRTTPIVYTTDGDRLVIIASKGGAPTSPDWYHNLVAHPDVTVELPNETFEARARVAEEPERERLYHRASRADAELRRVRESDDPQDSRRRARTRVGREPGWRLGGPTLAGCRSKKDPSRRFPKAPSLMSTTGCDAACSGRCRADSTSSVPPTRRNGATG